MNSEAQKALTGSDRFTSMTEPLARAVEESAKARGEVTAAERGMQSQREATRARDVAGVEQTFARQVREAPQRAEIERVSARMEEPFIPTRDNATSLASIFALTNIAGFALGSGGKRNAQAAMSAMNGMLEGFQQGRMDLYKKEKDLFDTNMKQLKMRYDTLDRQLREALETYKTDKQAGLAQAEVAYAEAGADFQKRYAEKYGLAAAYEFNKQALDNVYKALQAKEREEDRAERLNRAARAEERAARREERAEARFENLISKATTQTAKKEGKPLPDKQVRDIEGLASIENGLVQLAKDWRPEYAQFGMPFGIGAEQMAEAQRRGLGGPSTQAALSWWSRYERIQAPGRHALFGATLTGNELKNYRDYTAKKSDSADTVETYLNDQINFVRNSAANKIFTAEGAGYKVPEIKPRNFEQTFGGATGAAPAPAAPAAPAAGSQNIEAQARAAFGSYEPDKYEYGVNPATGKFARRKKE